ncbi:hypothetical protein EIN_094530 [Entamoeba invadens IP1]|uniref:rhomboid protease n=1 Tax=Entamoeba invadens IP1 TaxID=370355 RepID=A0A0A1U5X8_ENTIV|nr:hypothetical protein EIN_094530 [Entamoeba invadens IP1]ELP87236.1 hypothetical protein EIN_094530 [Entamoeba invadens IP1]|eukprot:XP_004254007.1 hypothetical protein EIN_094530 [Entamoeba invadens IP1]
MADNTLLPLYGTSSDDKEKATTMVDMTQTSSSSSSDDTFNFGTLFLPHHSEPKDDSFVDIDGFLVPFDKNENIIKRLIYCIFPCCLPPFVANSRLEKYLRACVSVSFFLSLTLTAVFISELVMCGIGTFAENPAIGPSVSGIVKYGAKYPYGIKQSYEAYRLFVPIILSPSLMSLLLQVFFTLRFFLYFEHRWGILIFCATYLLTGEAGVLLSCVLSCNSVAVCSSGPFAGLIVVFLIDLALTDDPRRFHFKRSVFTALVALLVIVFVELFPLQDFTCILGSVIVGLALGVLYFVHLNKWFTEQPLLMQTAVYVSLVVFLLLFYTVCCLLIFIWIEPLAISV